MPMWLKLAMTAVAVLFIAIPEPFLDIIAFAMLAAAWGIDKE